MGTCDSMCKRQKQPINQIPTTTYDNRDRQNELIINEHELIKASEIKKIGKKIWKIIVNDYKGTGFFMTIGNNNYLLTNYHVISEKIKNIKIELWNNNIIQLNLNDRYIKYINEKNNINNDNTIIHIKQNEINGIEFLDYDINYLKGYNNYLNINIICAGYPDGDELAVSKGNIKK